MKAVCKMNNKRRRKFLKLWKEQYGGLICAYCEAETNKYTRMHRVPQDACTIDHLIPTSRGGGNDRGNLVVACLKCNELKADLLINEFGNLKLLPIVEEIINA